MSGIVYFSSRSENTQRFVEKLGMPALRLLHDAPSRVDASFVLITPTYGDASGRGAVPGPVIRFLNVACNRALLRGVIAAGNTSFGASFAAAGRVISEKCSVPLLYRFELLGTSEDVANVKEGLKRCWTRWQ